MGKPSTALTATVTDHLLGVTAWIIFRMVWANCRFVRCSVRPTEAFWTRDAELSRFRYLDRTARRLIWDVDPVAPYPWLIYLIGSTIEKAHSPVRLYISARFCRV